jgi:hypothetical protein
VIFWFTTRSSSKKEDELEAQRSQRGYVFWRIGRPSFTKVSKGQLKFLYTSATLAPDLAGPPELWRRQATILQKTPGLRPKIHYIRQIAFCLSAVSPTDKKIISL